MRKFLVYAALAFIVFYVVSTPAAAAESAHGLLNGLEYVASGVSEFLARVVAS